jgi:hypothetical protein
MQVDLCPSKQKIHQKNRQALEKQATEFIGKLSNPAIFDEQIYYLYTMSIEKRVFI